MVSQISAKDQARRLPRSARNKERELMCYGLHICAAIAKCRQSDIIRVYCTDATMSRFASLLRWCATAKKAYHIVQNDELERISGSVHHEGVAILVRRKREGGLKELEKVIASKEEPLVYLDGVQNPHNVGTIMRVMAHFGWQSLVASQNLPSLTAAAARISEGGAEYVNVYKIPQPSDFWKLAQRHDYQLCGTSSHAATSLYEADFPKKVVFALGHEVQGMSAKTLALMDQRLLIPGSGQVESLNVAVTSALLLGEYCRRFGLKSN